MLTAQYRLGIYLAQGYPPYFLLLFWVEELRKKTIELQGTGARAIATVITNV